jgi:hypothetical protein
MAAVLCVDRTAVLPIAHRALITVVAIRVLGLRQERPSALPQA